MIARRVDPELLDALPPDDPAAIRSRADLRRVNRWMNQPALMIALLRRYGAVPPRTILEPGCGDGTFMLRVARRLAPAWPTVTLRLIDRQALVSEATLAGFAALGWRAETQTADVFAALAGQRADIVAQNLFLHHFDASTLRHLMAAIAQAATFVAACEPRRSLPAIAGSRLLGLIGCNHVTRHDAVVSVRAGFRDAELGELWPAGQGWELREAPAGLFSHCFTGRRRA